ncbi:MAG: hypothetical protein ACKO3M_00560 [Rubrivivax sp.]
MERLHERDSLHRLAFVDIAASGFDPRDWGDGKATLDDMRRLIHAVRPDGGFLLGVDALWRRTGRWAGATGHGRCARPCSGPWPIAATLPSPVTATGSRAGSCPGWQPSGAAGLCGG